jgi:hypothetical protein
MRFLRPFIFGILLASAFFYFTTYRHAGLHAPSWMSHPQQVEITEAAGGESLDGEEQNNITVYRKCRPLTSSMACIRRKARVPVSSSTKKDTS